MKLVHTSRMAIRWGDMDAFGHVNNTVYFRYIEQARINWFEQIGRTLEPGGEGPVIVNTACTFNRQLKYPGEIEVRTFAGPPGRSSFETRQEICRVDTPEILHAEGTAKIVWVDLAEEKSKPIPDWLRAILE